MNFINFISAALAFLSGVIFIYSILKGESRPSLAALTVFFFVISASIISGLALGGTLAIIPSVVNLILLTTGIIIILVKKIGYISFSNFDKLCLFIVFIGFLLWPITKNPFTLLVISTLIDIVGVLLVIKKLLKDKHSESLASWLAVSLSYLIPVFFAHDINLHNSLYSISNGLFCLLIPIILCFQSLVVKLQSIELPKKINL